MHSSPSLRAMQSKAAKLRAYICFDGSLPNRWHRRWAFRSTAARAQVTASHSPMFVRISSARAQQRVWGHLWRLIEDAAYAETQRVRTTFGQAVYAKMQTGQCYALTIQHNGGLLLHTRGP